MMKKKQIAGLLILTFVWLTTCGFVSWGDAADAGIAEVVEPMTSEDFEVLEIMEEWENLCMPNVKEYVTIRSEATAESEAVGRLYKGGAAEVVELGETWTKIVSGDCEGYISNDYLEFGVEAKAIADRDCGMVAPVPADGLKVRAEASEESKVRGLLGRGEKADVIGEEEGWMKIKFDDKEAFIKAEYTDVAFEVGEAQTMEQIREAEAAAEAARKKAALKKQYEAVRASGNEVQVLGALIQIESGNQPYEGQLAVGAVVMNRVRSSRYPNTIADVIYAPGQFPYASIKVHEVMARGVKVSCLQAAQEAINGVSNVGSFTHFKSARSAVAGAHIVIGGHVFY